MTTRDLISWSSHSIVMLAECEVVTFVGTIAHLNLHHDVSQVPSKLFEHHNVTATKCNMYVASIFGYPVLLTKRTGISDLNHYFLCYTCMEYMIVLVTPYEFKSPKY